MGLREEIDGLPRYGCEFEYVRQVDVLRIIDKHAAPVVDFTPGGQIKRRTMADAGPPPNVSGEPAWLRELERLKLERSRKNLCLLTARRLDSLEPLDALRRVILSGKGEAVIPEAVAKFMPIEGGGHYPAGKWEHHDIYADWVLADKTNGIYSADKGYILLAIDSYANSLINP